MSDLYTISGESFALVICTCGVRFLIPEILDRRALDYRGPQGHKIYCPNGHQWHYAGDSEADKLRRETQRLTQRLAQKDDDIRYQREARERTERRLSAVKGVATRMRNRAVAGVCPCCNRTFSQLQRHMKSEHPNYGTQPVEPPELKVVAGGKS